MNEEFKVGDLVRLCADIAFVGEEGDLVLVLEVLPAPWATWEYYQSWFRVLNQTTGTCCNAQGLYLEKMS